MQQNVNIISNKAQVSEHHHYLEISMTKIIEPYPHKWS